MQVYVLDNNYSIIGVIDEAESVLWNKKYNDVGDSEIYIPCNATYLDLLRKGNYLYRYDDDMVCKIQKREIETDVEDGDYLIVPGTDLCCILAGRIIRWKIVYSGTVAGFIEKVLTDNVINPAQSVRAIPNFRVVLDESNGERFTERIETSTFTEDLLQLIITTCKTYNYGFRLTYNVEPGEFVFRLYKGKNKSLIDGAEYVEFSPTFSNILSSSFIEDESNLKNVVYVGYKSANKDDETVYLLSMYRGDSEPQGEARREIYVDGTGTSRDIAYAELQQMFPDVTKTTDTNAEGKPTATYYNGEQIVATSEGSGDEEKISVSDYTYLLLIRELGNNALAEHTEITDFSGNVDTIDTYEYKVDYNIGDIVRVVNEHGIEAEARIVEIMESDDNEDGYVVEPVFEYIS